MRFSDSSSNDIWADFDKNTPAGKHCLPTLNELYLQDKIRKADEWAAECAMVIVKARDEGASWALMNELKKRYSKALDQVTELNLEMTRLHEEHHDNE